MIVKRDHYHHSTVKVPQRQLLYSDYAVNRLAIPVLFLTVLIVAAPCSWLPVGIAHLSILIRDVPESDIGITGFWEQ
jgi:hypothetical protein